MTWPMSRPCYDRSYSARQAACFTFIKARIDETNVPPTLQEIADHLDLRSKSGIHRLVAALEARGLIRRLPNRARAIEVLDPKNGDLWFLPSMSWIGLRSLRKLAPSRLKRLLLKSSWIGPAGNPSAAIVPMRRSNSMTDLFTYNPPPAKAFDGKTYEPSKITPVSKASSGAYSSS
jgi:hypothetical protein